MSQSPIHPPSDADAITCPVRDSAMESAPSRLSSSGVPTFARDEDSSRDPPGPPAKSCWPSGLNAMPEIGFEVVLDLVSVGPGVDDINFAVDASDSDQVCP